jgi:hypothetical protein
MVEMFHCQPEKLQAHAELFPATAKDNPVTPEKLPAQGFYFPAHANRELNSVWFDRRAFDC